MIGNGLVCNKIPGPKSKLFLEKIAVGSGLLTVTMMEKEGAVQERSERHYSECSASMA